MEDKEINVKAPGKILWLGGYSAVEKPNIAYSTAVNTYASAEIKLRKDNKVEFHAPQLRLTAQGIVDTGLGTINADIHRELFLLKTASEIGLRYVAALGVKFSGFSITTRTDKEFAYSSSEEKVVKSGLGSSAAITVAVIGAVLKAFGVDARKDDALHKLSQASHGIAEGKVGSGFDISTAVYGSIFYSRYSPDIVKSFPKEYTNDDLLKLVKREWDYQIEQFALPERFKIVFANFGESMITTKALSSMSEFKIKDPRTYNDLIREINGQNLLAVDALRKIKKGTDAMDAFKEAFERGRMLTKKLGMLSGIGIEPDDCTKLIEDSRHSGAFVAKLPGAGGKDSIAALTVGDEDYNSLRAFWKSKKELSVLGLNAVEQGAI